MIMTKAPFRISFAGGGSDLRDFYSKNGYGAVLSTSIDKYMYLMIHPYFHDKIRINIPGQRMLTKLMKYNIHW